MATVYNVEEVELQDGSTVTLRPANIKTLRVFMKHIEKLAECETEEETIDVILDAAIICLKKQKPEFADREVAEEALDLDTIYKVLEVCGGVKLNDPKLMEMAQQMAMQQASGTTD